ncbi:MAG: hypothetical protein MRJ93_07350 [Nitrososphaeraceae archaeon]|nr:hypothetical protein [Nitrososphaeraceae archaeon]
MEKSLIERVMQYFKDRTECFDEYYSCVKKSKNNCDLQHVYNWIKLFSYSNNTIQESEAQSYSELEVNK